VAHLHSAALPGALPMVAVWFAMMAAMMAPTAWPWVLSFHRLSGRGQSPASLPTAMFASGYLVAWLGYSTAAVALQRVLAPSIVDDARLPAALFLIAGLYQFAALKTACLAHCRSPLSYFLARWRDGAAGSFAMGIRHGAYCVGCCWALMATMLAAGLMNAWWMAALAALTAVEQVAPSGHRVRRPAGVALILLGLWFLAGARL